MGIFLDIIILAVFGVAIAFGMKKGFVRTVVDFVGGIIAAVAASVLGRLVSAGIFDAFIRPSLVASLSEKIGETANAAQSSLKEIAKAMEALPGFLKEAVEGYGFTPETVSGALSDSSGGQSLAEGIIDTAVAPVVTSMVNVVAFIVLFAVLMLLVRVVSNVLGKSVRLTLLRGPDSFLGGALGLLKGALLIFCVMMLMKIISGWTENYAPPFSDEVFETSLLFRGMYEINPFNVFIV